MAHAYYNVYDFKKYTLSMKQNRDAVDFKIYLNVNGIERKEK